MIKQKNCGMQIAECGLKNIALNYNVKVVFPVFKSAIRNQKSEIRTGFTLVELLIALAISSIIFLVIISTYSLTINMREKWGRREEDYYLARNIFKRMHSEISSLYFISDPRPAPEGLTEKNNSDLKGDEKTFSFYTTAKSLYFPFSCLMKVTYKFIADDDEKSLLVREEEPLINFSLEENAHLKSYVWSETLKDFSFQYSDGKKWYDEWDSKEKRLVLRAIKIVLISSHKETFSTTIYIPTEI